MDKYKWDLTKMFKNEKEFLDSIETIKKEINNLLKYKGKILDSADNLYSLLEEENSISMLCEKVYVYAFLGYYDNTVDNKFQDYKEKAISIFEKFDSESSFITPELLQKDYDYVLKLTDGDSRFDKYKHYFEKIYRYKDHVLSEECEKLLSDASCAFDTSSSAYTSLNNTDIRFDDIIDEKGNEVHLTSSNYSKYISSKDENVRINAFKSMYKFYKEHINTISALLIGNVKTNSFLSKVKKYKSSLESHLFGDNISTDLYETLIKVTDKHIPSLQKYYDLKSRVIGKKMHIYDVYLNIASCEDKVVSYEEAIKIVNNALSPLGSDYLKEFNNILNSNLVDVYPKENKRSGAYEWGCFGCDPYVSLNYENNVESVSTLIHEMGHAMHTYYSINNQDYIYANYPIFLAEIASTVNEVLLSNYFFENTNDIDEKIYYLVEFLDKFKATVYRQVMFAEFENIIHNKYENGESLTKDLLCDEYYKLNLKHFSPTLIVDEDIKYEWAKIPHFFSSFYVYKYATGFISALVIADKLMNNEEGFKDKYINFLSSGCKDYPLNLLNELGIDITDENVLDKAFDVFNDKVKLLEKYLDEKGV